MRDELRLQDYYERELTFLRQMGARFAEKYPAIASRLLLERNKCEDPHVERLLEAFAFLAARVHLKIEDDFPEITTALLGILYPHYLRPIPSMSVVQFHSDPEQGKLSTSVVIPRGKTLYSKPVSGVPCKFQTCYETTLWPLEVADAGWTTPDRLQPAVRDREAVAVLRVELRCFPDVTFEKLELDSLRFYLDGESRLVHTLYELLCNNCTRIVVRKPDDGPAPASIELPGDALRPVGFEEDESLLPYPRRSFAGYRLLQEYFAFPEKFFFVEITGLAAMREHSFKDRAEILFLISRFERPDRHERLATGISAQTMRLGCAPIVNLFAQTAEPILVDQRRYEYPVIPDVRRRSAMDIFSVDEVVSTNPQSRETVIFQPFYSFRRGSMTGKPQVFWHMTRRSADYTGDEESETFLTIVDTSGRVAAPGVDVLTVRCTCTNRDLPSRLPFGSEGGDFEMEGMATIRRIVVLLKPTESYSPPSSKDALWRLISHLSLNYLSIVSEGKEALQEILSLYNFSDSPDLRKQISGIVGLASRPQVTPIVSEHGISSARGTRVELELDEEQFAGTGVYLFSNVLERFLGWYVSMNSYCQLAVRTKQRKEFLREWPPRSGQALLI
jgi:type VI secretion system protein ImpG